MQLVVIMQIKNYRCVHAQKFRRAYPQQYLSAVLYYRGGVGRGFYLGKASKFGVCGSG